MYVFDLEMFIEDCVKSGSDYKSIAKDINAWARSIDGKPVDRHKELWGICGGFIVDKDWCKEVDHVMKFSKELYLEKSEFRDEWCELIDGEFVNFEKPNDTYGFCKDYIILKDWCKEITL